MAFAVQEVESSGLQAGSGSVLEACDLDKCLRGHVERTLEETLHASPVEPPEPVEVEMLEEVEAELSQEVERRGHQTGGERMRLVEVGREVLSGLDLALFLVRIPVLGDGNAVMIAGEWEHFRGYCYFEGHHVVTADSC